MTESQIITTWKNIRDKHARPCLRVTVSIWKTVSPISVKKSLSRR